MAKKVLAACDGVITHIQNGKNGKKGALGIVTLYNEEFNITFRYLHCEAESNTVEEGAQVKKGQHILNQGTTGTDATHLHFEVHEGNIEKSTHHTKLDPITYIPELLIWLDQTPSQHGNTDRSRDMETSYSNGSLFSQRYIDQNKKDLLRNAFLLLKKRNRLGEIPTVTKRVLCENGLGDKAFCASTKFPVTTPSPTATPVTQVSAPPTKKAKYPTTAIKTTETPKEPYKVGGYPTTPYPDSLASSAPVNTDPDKYVNFWYGVIWGVVAQENGGNPKIKGQGKYFSDLTKLDGGTAGIAHFAQGGLKRLYKTMEDSIDGGTYRIFGKQTNQYSDNASTYDNLVAALKKNTTPSKRNDNGTGPSTDEWWRNGMKAWLENPKYWNAQLLAIASARRESMNDAIELGGWKTDRQLAIAAGISNSQGPGGFRTVAKFHNWDEEALLEGYKRKFWYVYNYRNQMEEYENKNSGHNTRRATAIDFWFPIDKQKAIIEGGKIPSLSKEGAKKVALLIP
tara:strand:- start:851 stop:2383 length:1533 start_codon:yes stop_codon:yes gene_type:complete